MSLIPATEVDEAGVNSGQMWSFCDGVCPTDIGSGKPCQHPFPVTPGIQPLQPKEIQYIYWSGGLYLNSGSLTSTLGAFYKSYWWTMYFTLLTLTKTSMFAKIHFSQAFAHFQKFHVVSKSFQSVGEQLVSVVRLLLV